MGDCVQENNIYDIDLWKKNIWGFSLLDILDLIMLIDMIIFKQSK